MDSRLRGNDTAEASPSLQFRFSHTLRARGGRLRLSAVASAFPNGRRNRCKQARPHRPPCPAFAWSNSPGLDPHLRLHASGGPRRGCAADWAAGCGGAVSRGQRARGSRTAPASFDLKKADDRAVPAHRPESRRSHRRLRPGVMERLGLGPTRHSRKTRG